MNPFQATKKVVIPSDQREPRDLRTDLTALVNEVRRSFDALQNPDGFFRLLRMTAWVIICNL